MDQQVKTSSKVPIFSGEDYAFMENQDDKLYNVYCTRCLAVCIKGYIHPETPHTYFKGIKEFGQNAKAVTAILDGLTKIVFAKVMHCKTTKDVWDTSQTIYEGDIKLKRDKLHTFKNQFERLKMKEE